MKTKHGNKWFSKLIALCLAVVMVMSLGMTVSAANAVPQTGDFTVGGFEENADSITVSAYQIITVNLDAEGQPQNPMYKWADSVAAWVTENYSDYIDNEKALDDSGKAVTDAFESADAEDMTTFLEAMAAAIKTPSAGLNVPVAKTATPNKGTATFTGMAIGEYLLTANGGVRIYQPTTVTLVPEYNDTDKEWELQSTVGTEETGSVMKSVEPSIDKSVKDNGDDEVDNTVAVGDTVTFLLDAIVPSYPEGATAKKFEISDNLGTGLAFVKDTVKVWSDEDATIPLDKSYYKVTAPYTAKNRTFLVEFTEAFFKNYTGTHVYVTYDATVTSDAFANGGVMENDAFLGYNTDPYDSDSYKEDDDNEKVYTYTIDLTKVNSAGQTIKEAEFNLKEGNDTLYFKNEGNGTYTYASKTASGTLTSDLATVNGKLILRGLDEGTYTLVETSAPDGYVLPNGTITITLADNKGVEGENGPDGTLDEVAVTANGNAGIHEIEPDKDYTIKGTSLSFQVENKNPDEAGFQLPTTGGMGTMIFTIAGILLMGGAAVLVVMAARRKRG